MLESTYLIIGILAFLSLILSFFNKKRPVRLILQLIATVLFASNAIASTQVERFYCENAVILTNQTNSTYSGGNNTLIQYNNDIICEKNATFDQAAVWIFGGMIMISTVIAFFTAINIMSMREED